MGEMAVDIGQRIVQRRYAPKTRTGCVTCKIRRVKCDEARPSCKRCTSTGRKCDGYVTTSPSRKPSITLTVALNSESNYGPNERRCFEFFRARTGPCISGYFPDPVWDRFVLQISNTEPPVRHAIHAVAALHEDLEDHRVRGTSRAWQSVPRFAAVEYAKALKGLQSLLKRDHIHLDVILICALLMVHFESMRECFVPALLHCDNTIRLLHESTTFDARKVDPGIVRSLMRLDLQGSCYLAMRSPGMPFFTSEVDNDLPATFRDLPQARDFVYTWTSRLYHFMRNVADEHKFRNPGKVPLEELAAAHDLTQTFINIDKLLWDYMHKPTTRLPVIEQQGLGMLRARVKMNRILAACCLYCEATIYDAFLAEFEDIMSICNWIIESDTGDRRLFSVSLDEGLLSPLFYTATHCRDHRLRHKALMQLQKLPRDGVWHVEMVTRTAEIAIQFEESHCSVDAPRCHDIPEWTRVHCAGFDGWVSDESKSEAVAHLRLRPNGMDGEWVDFSQTIGYEYHVPTDMITLFDVASPFMLDACKRQLNSEKPFSPRETRFLVWP